MENLNKDFDENVSTLNIKNIANQIPIDNEILLLGECTHTELMNFTIFDHN